MRVLITGSSGFIGRYLAEKLNNRGVRVVATSRSCGDSNSNCEFVQADLDKQFNYNESVDVIIHTAGKFYENGADINTYMLNNYETTKNIIDYARNKKVKKIIYLSSIKIYGAISENILTEETPIINQDYYGLTKYLGECLLKDSEDINSVCLRLPGVVGNGATTPWIIKILNKMINNENVEYFNGQGCFNNIVHLLDLEKFIFKLINDDFRGFDVINLGCIEHIKIIDMLEIIKYKLNSKSKLILKDNNNLSFTIATNKALKYGYESMSIKDTIEYILKEGNNGVISKIL